MLTRTMAVAGLFYPADPNELGELVERLLAHVTTQTTKQPKALIVPHAGYIYSGYTAAFAYHTLTAYSDSIRRVVLVGLSHRVPFHGGIAVSPVQQFQTPLGNVPVDMDAIKTLQKSKQVVESEEAHRLEHSLEVQLPFLQKVLPSFELIPLATGDCTPEEVANCLSEYWEDDSTLVIISSDLSHFHTYEEATKIDKATCDQILAKKTTLKPEQACGCQGINGLLTCIKNHPYDIELLDYRNSGDTAGSKERVVGYGAFAIYAK